MLGCSFCMVSFLVAFPVLAIKSSLRTWRFCLLSAQTISEAGSQPSLPPPFPSAKQSASYLGY